MKKLVTFMVLVLVTASGASACDGMLSLFSDQSAGDCSARIGHCQTVPLYLMYIRGDGPEIANGVAFRLLKSSPDAMFLEPQWPGENLSIGSLESGIDVCIRASEGWCSGNADVAYIGTIPVVNFGDPDMFTVSVVGQPSYGGIFVLKCELGYPMHRVIGGTFVFNGRCHSAEDPFAESVAVGELSWGAIKNLYR